jgi:glycerate kinase
MNILIAPSGFKECLGSDEVAEFIAAGILHALPDATIHKAPLVDGGEGFARFLVRATGGILHTAKVTGPVGYEIDSHFGFLGGVSPKTAVLEMAAAAGLRLVPNERRDPLQTTTFGVGELIKAALDSGAERLIIGCGDSGTMDGGAGMAQALGVNLLDVAGRQIPWGGAALGKLARIDMTNLDPRMRTAQIDVACNWNSVLCGPRGISKIFGPQKGASPEAVQLLTIALENYGDVIQRDLGIDVRTMPGSGAAGGLGAALHAFLKANLCWRYDVLRQYVEIDTPLRKADLVITGEGCIDDQTPVGKIPAEVARWAKAYNLPVIAIAGQIGRGAEDNFASGVDSYMSILETPTTLSEAMEQAPDLLSRAAERVMRLIQVGQKLAAAESERVDAIPFRGPSVNYTEDKDSAELPLLSIFARELREPLALIIGNIEMLRSRSSGEINAAQDRALRNVLQQAMWLVRIMNAFFQSLDPQSEGTANQSERAYRDNWATH